VKTRIAVDLSATGINGASPTPPFSYPGPQDGLQLVTRGCWLGKTDLERYFYCFPLAEESYKWFMVAWLGIVYYFSYSSDIRILHLPLLLQYMEC
jgi:hypothetical protein